MRGARVVAPPPKDPSAPGVSVIYSYGVRVSYSSAKDGGEEFGWICLGSQECRDAWTMYPLYGGKTSNATKHISSANQVSSKKTLQELSRKRTRAEEVEDLRLCPMFKNDPTRMRLLLETRKIVLNNRPFSSGEEDDEKTINELMVLDQFKATIHHKAVTKTIIEMYSATKREVVMLLKTRQPGIRSLTVVIDFWSCKPQQDKYLGVRVYFIDKAWEFRSILLGVRRFEPSCEQRIKGFRGAFKAWLLAILVDFKIKQCDVFGSMTDGASEMKDLLADELKFAWEWCIPHLTSAATKWACGMTDNVSDSENPGLTTLIEKMRITIRQAVCLLEDTSESTKLVDYRSQRFLGLKMVIERILEKWKPLVVYYGFSAERPVSAKAPKSFLLAKKEEELKQLLSLLTPITMLNKLSQSEDPNQVKSLFLFCNVRRVTLNPKAPLRHYQSTPTAPKFIPVEDLTSTVLHTRNLLATALDTRFFSRRVIESQYGGELSAELADEYGSVQLAEEPIEIIETRIDEKLLRWNAQKTVRVDSVLKYWERQTNNFKLLSRVSKVLFAFPTSSGQIERDFGDCGRMVTTERVNLKSTNVEMASFVRANKEFIRLMQCDKTTGDLSDHIPRHMLMQEEDSGFLPAIFSRLSCEDG